ncbi:MAG: mechanosensitive ion channel domain-containing protein [Solirubrobacteraceae bacterium]
MTVAAVSPAQATVMLSHVAFAAVRLLDVTLVGVTKETGVKLLYTIALVVIVLALRRLAGRVIRRGLGGEVADPRRFWARQGVSVVTAVVLLLGVLSIWITPHAKISTALGLVSAGLALALQQVIMSLAAYFVILRGDIFEIGDRVTLGDVRGDVVSLGFIKTTIMEMGQPPTLADTSPDTVVWVNSRQYTGRLVTVTNGVIFTNPVYNYTRDFPYLWEEIVIPVDYDVDRAYVERVLLEVADAYAVIDDADARQALAYMRSRYAMADASLEPTVFWRITDNWLEMSLRFLVPARGVRTIKSDMSREILAALDRAHIGIASATYNIVGLPAIKLTDTASTDGEAPGP